MRPDQAARYARQILLSGVGPEGQERVLAARASVAGEGLEHEIASRYARRAGFGEVTAGPIVIDEPSLGHEAPRRVLAGSRAALRAFRAAALAGSER